MATVVLKNQIKGEVKTVLNLLIKRIFVFINTAFVFYMMLDVFNVLHTSGDLSFKDFFTNPECGKYWILAVVFNVLSGYFHPERFKSMEWIWIVVFYIMTLTGFCIVY